MRAYSRCVSTRLARQIQCGSRFASGVPRRDHETRVARAEVACVPRRSTPMPPRKPVSSVWCSAAVRARACVALMRLLRQSRRERCRRAARAGPPTRACAGTTGNARDTSAAAFGCRRPAGSRDACHRFSTVTKSERVVGECRVPLVGDASACRPAARADPGCSGMRDDDQAFARGSPSRSLSISTRASRGSTRQRGHLPAEPRDAAVAVDGAELLQQPIAVVEQPRVRRIEERKLLRRRRAPARPSAGSGSRDWCAGSPDPV